MQTLIEFCKKRLSKSGGSYFYFGIFGVLNYPLSYLFYIIFDQSHTQESLALRILATLLCLGLVINHYFPKLLGRFLPIYWYVTILYCLPFFGVYMLLKNQGSLSWLMNDVLGLFLLVLLVDSLMFVILFLLGSFLGFIAYSIIHHEIIWSSSPEHTTMALYMYLFAVVLGTIFARKKESFQENIIKNKEQINQLLEQKVYERTLYLEEALQAKRNLLANVSHEVRTPLHGILNLAQMMFEGWGEPNKENIRTLYDVSRRLEELVSNILDLSAIEADQMKLSPSEFDVLDLQVKSTLTAANSSKYCIIY